MKANEMTHEQLADEMDSLDVDPARWEWKDGSHNEYYNRLNEAFEEATERLRTLTALSILAPEPRTEPPGVDEVGDGYGDEDEAWAYDSVFEAYIKRRGKVIRAHWGQHFNAWLPIEALPMPKGGADESEAMATKTWICYEIHRPNIPVHGCKTQCKECAERDTKALGMEGDK